MAEEKEPFIADGHDFAFKFIGLALIIFSLGTVFEKQGWVDFLDNNEVSDQADLTLSQTILQSKLDLGDHTRNITGVIVRQSPGGQVIGRQAARTYGRIVEGPVRRFDMTWWRVDYENAPDGWVEGILLSNKTKLLMALNIVPITFGFLAPVGIILSVILVILILIVFLKSSKLKKEVAKKQSLKSEQKILKDEHQDHIGKSQDDAAQDDEQIPGTAGEESEKVTASDLPVPGLPIGEKPATQKPSNRRWENIQSLINSYNQNDWKQAIIEADTILDEMLDKMSYEGQSIGDKLKQIESSDFLTLNQAWEAHKVRNRIAHSGTNFVLSKDEAVRVINLYKEVFNEFFYI
jgi:hypothetical protein